MMHQCVLCGYIYDEDTETVAFEELDDGYKCPLCLAGKDAFRPLNGMNVG